MDHHNQVNSLELPQVERPKNKSASNSAIHSISYESFYATWRKAHETKKNGTTVQNDCNRFWRQHKKDQVKIYEKYKENQVTATRRDSKQSRIDVMFANIGPRPAKNLVSSDSSEAPVQVTSNVREKVIEDEPSCSEKLPEENSDNLKRKYKTLAQDKLNEDLQSLSDDIKYLQKKKSRGQATEDEVKTLKNLLASHSTAERKLKRLKNQQKYNLKCRTNKARKVKELQARFPEIQELQTLEPNPVGRPRAEQAYRNLQDLIIEIAGRVSGAHPRRRDETLRTCRTLAELTNELNEQGIHLSSQTIYLRLQPRKANSAHGKRHVKTVPVKLARAQNSLRKTHADSHFAAATVKNLRELAEIMGGNNVLIISQDDKARVPIGIVAANKQLPILMHMEYQVVLPDHDFVVAPRHKLIPSVYVVLVQDKNDKVTYSGPTHIAIRSGKHDSSTADSHHYDLEALLSSQDPDVKKHIVDAENRVKPIVILLTDGGPDENPRFEKNIVNAIDTFITKDLDCMFLATYAPGQSAYNPVERRMAPLSRDLAGIILKHDTFGSHIDSSGKTIDAELEKRNFQEAGLMLAEIWSENLIDGYPVNASYIPPDTRHRDKVTVTEDWFSRHVRASQYFLQIVKCFENTCCPPFKTEYGSLFPHRFIPGPMPFRKSESGLMIDTSGDKAAHFSDLWRRLALMHLEPTVSAFRKFPYDFFCPSTKDSLVERVCSSCGMYFPSLSRLKKHSIIHTTRLQVGINFTVSYKESQGTDPSPSDASDDEDNNEVIETSYVENEASQIETIALNDIEKWSMPPFIDTEDLNDDSCDKFCFGPLP